MAKGYDQLLTQYGRSVGQVGLQLNLRTLDGTEIPFFFSVRNCMNHMSKAVSCTERSERLICNVFCALSGILKRKKNIEPNVL